MIRRTHNRREESVYVRRRAVSRAARNTVVSEMLEERRYFAFGVTTTTGSTASYVINNGGDIQFSVLRPGATISSTIHLGDVTSIKFKGQEVMAPFSSSGRYSHYEQGLGSITTVNTLTGGTVGSRWILVTCDDSAEASGAVIQYYAVRENDDNIYMASLPMDVNNGPGEGRFITYLSRTVFPAPEEPSDNAPHDASDTVPAIEGSDVFGHDDGTTSSKFYNMNRRMIDNIYHGVTGTSGAQTVGAWMFMGNREHSAGGPFFKDIDFQSSNTQVELYNCVFTGHTQTEAYRQGLEGPYALQLTNGTAPTTLDYSWLETLKDGSGNLLIQGLIPAAQRGSISGTASGVPSGHQIVVGLSNSTAQYWAYANAGTGAYSISGVQPGTYTETLYDTELAVGTKTVTITAGAATNANIVDTFYIPSSPIFRIGTWDGTPLGFLNSEPDATFGLPKISIMHPSDVRMDDWNSTPNFVVGTNTDSQWPLAQFMGVNNSQRITFTLTAAQVQNMTMRIGITWGFSGARPKITVNAGQTGTWTSANPSASADLNSRGITRGTWRGDNQLYTFPIPSSAFHAGTNTIDLPLISGSFVAGQTWLSPNVAYDAIDLAPTTSANAPAIASVTITPSNSNIGVNGTRTFTAVAKDANGNVITANIDWSAARGTIDANGNYTAPATAGADTITATANTTRISGYSTGSSGTSSAFTSTITGTGSTTVSVLGTTPIVVTPAAASPNPAFSLSTALSVLGNDDGGESNLTYTWSVVGTPPGTVNFSVNGTNAAKNTTATFGTYGTYNLLVTITDASSNSITSPVTVVTRQYVARYKADETSGTTLADSSGGNNTATLNGSYGFVAGQAGGAVQLTGGYASIPTGIVSTLNDFTVSTWVKLDANSNWARIFDFGTGTSAYMFLTPSAGGTNALRFAITTSGGAGEKQLNGPAMSTGVWTHVAVTLSGNTATLYVNGSAVATNTSVTTHPAALGNTGNNYIGKSQFAADPALLGSIDDFRIYGRALSSTEVTQLANPVRVTAETFTYQTAEQLSLTFNRDVGASIDNTDLVIQNLDTQTIVPSSSVTLSYSSLTGQFTVTGVLPNGNYCATLPPTAVHDAAGITLGDDPVTFDFFVLMGDTNHDRTVDVTDLGNLAGSYGMTSGATWAQGDLNYDGMVDVTDLGDLASTYGTTLAAATSDASGVTGAGTAATIGASPMAALPMAALPTAQSATASAPVSTVAAPTSSTAGAALAGVFSITPVTLDDASQTTSDLNSAARGHRARGLWRELQAT